jgi:hypothetical protein
MKLRDGRSFGIERVSIDERADCCWCLTMTNAEQLPTTTVATKTPAAGTRIWHAGYGIDKPGNREDGTVTSGPNGDGQIEMRLSVSSGDSGGGIINNETGEVISCVCCTTARGATARVWGASPEAINKLRAESQPAEAWEPLLIPEIQIAGG